MGTITTRAIIDRLIAGNGWETPDDHDAPDNPPAARIVEYMTPEGQTCWGVVFEGEGDYFRYERLTEFVRSPRLLWARPGPPPFVPVNVQRDEDAALGAAWRRAEAALREGDLLVLHAKSQYLPAEARCLRFPDGDLSRLAATAVEALNALADALEAASAR